MLKFLPTVSIVALLAGCAPSIVTLPPASGCASRIPPQLRDAVAPVDLPDGTLGSLEIAFDGQTGKLEQANDEKATVIWICEQYEAEQAAVAETLRPRTAWERLTPWAE